ncbi:MAG: ester cyclase [Armatimonadota bacterium]|nr:ester cyclase [Armatimonadota bacterium]
MTAEDLIRLASENVEAWSSGDWERLRAPFSPDVRYYELGTQRRMRGIDELVESYKGWKSACPDGTGRVTKAFAGGNTVALEVIWSGTHTGTLVGPGGDIPPTGKSWMEPAAQLITFEGDKIVEFHHYFDMLTLLQQIGVAPRSAEVESIEAVVAAM